MEYEKMYDRLLDVTEEFNKQGATPFQVANIMARFLVELSFDCAPDPRHATHLLMTAMTDRIERDLDEEREKKEIA
jgi:hypothetical protein